MSPQDLASDNSTLVATDPGVFLGGDSGIYFTQLIMNAMNGSVSNRLRSEPFPQPWTSTPAMDTAAPDVFMLPPDSKELVDIFFNFHFELSPIFHKPTIEIAFKRVIDGDNRYREENCDILSIMNMIFAISCSHRRSNTERSGRSRSFYDAAMSLIQPTLLKNWKIQKIQTLLLGARYLQSSNSPDECWNVLGLAIRMAYGLELHHPPKDDLDFIAKETQKRVWYACFVQDKLLSMIYGKPAATSTSTFTTPLPEDLDDDCIQLDRLLYPSPRTPSVLSFFIQVAKLYQVMESTLAAHAREHVTGDALACTILSLDEEFEEWRRELPDHLRIYGSRIKQDNEQALILALRANMVRILIHRQALALTLSLLSGASNKHQGTDKGLKNNTLQSSRSICVQTAIDTITLVGLRHEKTAAAAGPSWFNLYYRMSSSICLKSLLTHRAISFQCHLGGCIPCH